MTFKKNKRVRKQSPHTNAKRATYDSIEFASKLEVFMYKLLKKNGVKFEYEGCVYPLLDEDEYDGECWERFTKRSKGMKVRNRLKKSIYTPDFVGENEEWIIETKGRKLQPFPIRWNIFKRTMNRRKNPPLLLLPTNEKDCQQVIEILRSRGFCSNDSKKQHYFNSKKKVTNGRRKES